MTAITKVFCKTSTNGEIHVSFYLHTFSFSYIGSIKTPQKFIGLYGENRKYPPISHRIHDDRKLWAHLCLDSAHLVIFMLLSLSCEVWEVLIELSVDLTRTSFILINIRSYYVSAERK